ncbi:hypothetical protein VOLCADRAFT_92221 [Volvox carteri f. nagariensis]|uniref:Uncharacterized protein n=1 Tax=Volvox carteri f. nagariensis TaxID=3068 RepID=D8TZ30_VOLCA|nr:uncharacterized protein VOLCADRAFT_92221 [Volvox carteri f. nagariensis]EFJ47108.1 hypothetical protein VOLCADRAFT_92221 [Volvox carteri f. nagariensis]|eukprot:XP_002951657.1 hypothetical protein VOLCADRAFT_92221 [Volvox carteri f. nagariensis]
MNCKHGKGTVAAGSTQSPLFWSKACFCSSQQKATPTARTAAARFGRGGIAEEAAAKDPPFSQPAKPTESTDDGGSTQYRQAQHEQPQQQRRQQQRRRQFGPEPPPPSDPAGVGSRTSMAEKGPAPSVTSPSPPTGRTGGVAEAAAAAAATAPKRRGRPPKAKASEVSIAGPAPPPPPQQPAQSSATIPLAEAAAAVAAAIVPETSSNSSSSGSSERRSFGPEPPSPSPPPRSDGGDGMPFPFTLPEDPRQLNADDILDLPLPDPRVGERFRLGGDLSELEELGEAAGVGGASSGGDDGDGADDDADLDYDELIALAGRVDAASYVARAFERAKQGLDPVPDPALRDVEAEVEAPAAPPSRNVGVEGRRNTDDDADDDTATAAAAPPSPQPPLLDAVYVDDEVEDYGGNAPGGGGGTAEEAQVAAQRRVALLVDLLAASGAELEAKLEAAAPEVDEQLLALLERRYTAALTLRQDAAAVERIATLYRALRYMYERRTSSPAERLLDDVLGILGDVELQPEQERRRGEAAARLRNAFTGGMLDVDVFTAAEALAEGRQAAAEALAGEQVSLESFKAEAMGLLDHARRVQQDTTSSLETIEMEVARLRSDEPVTLEGREWRVRLEQVRLARQALAEREQSISALEEVLLLTRAVELQILTGRLEGI